MNWRPNDDDPLTWVSTNDKLRFVISKDKKSWVWQILKDGVLAQSGQAPHFFAAVDACEEAMENDA